MTGDLFLCKSLSFSLDVCPKIATILFPPPTISLDRTKLRKCAKKRSIQLTEKRYSAGFLSSSPTSRLNVSQQSGQSDRFLNIKFLLNLSENLSALLGVQHKGSQLESPGLRPQKMSQFESNKQRVSFQCDDCH
jgi:hypothetical protein